MSFFFSKGVNSLNFHDWCKYCNLCYKNFGNRRETGLEIKRRIFYVFRLGNLLIVDFSWFSCVHDAQLEADKTLFNPSNSMFEVNSFAIYVYSTIS